jgi:hypothetical protein
MLKKSLIETCYAAKDVAAILNDLGTIQVVTMMKT